MNKRQKKKLQKRIDFSLEYGFDHIVTYKEIKWINKAYHEYCIESNRMFRVLTYDLWGDCEWYDELFNGRNRR